MGDSPQFSLFHHYNINKMSDKQAEREKKQAEVRARLEATTAQGRKKKGFMTPERKKKLRLLLRKNAAEALKKEQEEKAKLRQEMIEQRCGKPKRRFVRSSLISMTLRRRSNSRTTKSTSSTSLST